MNAAAGGQWSDLAARLVSGGVAAAVGLLAMWIGGLTFHVLIAVICGIMMWELLRMIGAEARATAMAAGAAVALLVAMEIPPGFAAPLLLAPAMLGVALIDEHRFTYAI